MRSVIMFDVPILCVNVKITIGTMLKFDTNADANVNIDAQCEPTLRTQTMLLVKGPFTDNVAFFFDISFPVF